MNKNKKFCKEWKVDPVMAVTNVLRSFGICIEIHSIINDVSDAGVILFHDVQNMLWKINIHHDGKGHQHDPIVGIWHHSNNGNSPNFGMENYIDDLPLDISKVGDCNFEQRMHLIYNLLCDTLHIQHIGEPLPVQAE